MSPNVVYYHFKLLLCFPLSWSYVYSNTSLNYTSIESDIQIQDAVFMTAAFLKNAFVYTVVYLSTFCMFEHNPMLTENPVIKDLYILGNVGNCLFSCHSWIALLEHLCSCSAASLPFHRRIHLTVLCLCSVDDMLVEQNWPMAMSRSTLAPVYSSILDYRSTM